jgi:hypothetical protein
MTSIIYLVESEQKHAQTIVNTAIQNSFEIYMFKKFSDLLSDVKKHRPDAILLNEKLLPDSYDEFLEINSYFIIVYGQRIELDARVNYYQMGVDRVLDREYATPQAFIQLLRKQQNYLEEYSPIQQGDIVHTSFRELSLANILQESMKDKRSFALKINDNGWSASLRVMEGRIDAVSSTEKTGAPALFDILYRSRGEIFLKYFPESNRSSSYDFSTSAALMEFQYQKKYLEDFEQMLGVPSPIFKRNNNSGQIFPRPEFQYIMDLIDEKLTLRKIILASPLPLKETTGILQELLQNDIVDVDHETMKEGKFTEEEIENLVESIFSSGKHEGQILVLSFSEDGKKNVIEGIASAFSRPVILDNTSEICEISLDNMTSLSFMGVSLDTYVKGNIQNTLSDLLAAIFIIDFSTPLTFDYKKYFIRQFLAERPISALIGVINLTRLHDAALQELRKILEIPADIPVISLDYTKISDLRNMVRQLIKLSDREKSIR